MDISGSRSWRTSIIAPIYPIELGEDRALLVRMGWLLLCSQAIPSVTAFWRRQAIQARLAIRLRVQARTLEAMELKINRMPREGSPKDQREPLYSNSSNSRPGGVLHPTSRKGRPYMRPGIHPHSSSQSPETRPAFLASE